MSITIVGLGPGAPRLLTREAWELLTAADEIWLRTVRHPTVAHLPPHLTLHSFDDLYESADDFAVLYRTIATRVMELGRRPAGVLYAVPGHPLVGESTVLHILAHARTEGLEVRIVEGLSFVESALTLLEIDGLEGLQVHDGIELAAGHHPPLNPDVGTLIGQVYSRSLSANLKLTLLNQYPEEHPVALLHAAGTPQAQVVRLPLYELDRHDVSHLTALYVPPLPATTSFEGFQETVAHLRAPDGCPWDRAQTHESLRTGLLEEVYEVVEAIDAGDTQGLQEELGDLLLQVVFQTQIATEGGDFRMVDVIAEIDAKLKHRHPHVWGGVVVENAQQVLANWEDLKREEKEERHSVLDGVPASLPALIQARVYGERVARVGFDWPSIDGVVEKVYEELDELQAASTPAEAEAELGDLLFAVGNWARHLDVDPESALRQANQRFARRFRRLEAIVRRRGQRLQEMSIDQMEEVWQEVKSAGRG
jgi:tetrapyrrole methylase family protein/MazG family protein